VTLPLTFSLSSLQAMVGTRQPIARDCERLAGLTTDRELRECLLRRLMTGWLCPSREEEVPKASPLKPANPLEPGVT
jgi:hypothetical protein